MADKSDVSTAISAVGAPSDGNGTRLGAIPVAPAAAADVTEGDPDGKGDLAALLKSAGSAGGGALAMAGVQQLMRFLDADKTMEGRAQSALEQNLLRAARAQIAGPDSPDGTAGPEGEARFQNFLGAYFPALRRVTSTAFATTKGWHNDLAHRLDAKGNSDDACAQRGRRSLHDAERLLL